MDCITTLRQDIIVFSDDSLKLSCYYYLVNATKLAENNVADHAYAFQIF